MKQVSIEQAFMPSTSDTSALRSKLKKSRNMADIIRALYDVPFDRAFDLLRASAAESVGKGEGEKVLKMFSDLGAEIAGLPDEVREKYIDLQAAVMQILTSLYIELDMPSGAATSAAEALNLLAQHPRRKDTPFLQILGSLLFDVATLHNDRHEYKQAERALEKSVRIFERLAKADANRYATAHVMALNGATNVYRNRVKQAELLAHYQVATSSYLQMLNSGVEEAAMRLVESLAAEGDTLVKMGRHREAMQYYTRALKYLTKIEPEFTLRQLQLSIALGESMLSVAAMRDKGVHLLNTMLHKATKIKAQDEHRRIVDILYHAKSRSLDILGLWHKFFPK